MLAQGTVLGPFSMTIETLDGHEVRTVVCGICEKQVTLEDCKIDENGQAVHEDCYVRVVSLDRSKVRAS